MLLRAFDTPHPTWEPKAREHLQSLAVPRCDHLNWTAGKLNQELP